MLTPLQEETLERIRPPRDAREPAHPDLAPTLRRRLDEGLADIDDELVVTKRKLALVHGCERHLLATDGNFEWSPPAAKGTVVHKAVELLVYRRGEPTPIDLVDEAIAALEAADGRSIGAFLAGLGEPDRTGLVADAARMVEGFMTTFPPLRRAWRPVAEGRVSIGVADGRIELIGKPDLTLGVPDGRVPGRVILDLKTGSPHRAHRDDLRFYALLDTLRCGVPPLQIASVFLDSGAVEVEAVDDGCLEAALRRTIDGTKRLAELEAELREPNERAGPMCRWCPDLDVCATGRAHAERDESDSAPTW